MLHPVDESRHDTPRRHRWRSLCLFSREQLLEQQCQLLESELAVMGEELSASREKIATSVLMWTGVRNELRQAEAELSQAKNQLQTSAGAC
ncbi:hypothetical protein QR297_12075 [Pseudomonas shirazica]|uniref:Uncharacterized protein n=1 Tax=Pseudomonas shirazica TaxID=1940636 RepID=A0ABY9SW18_9PSED|nr:hypothetical protein [Pseudomonas shirazica]WMY87537.1 hypothetical protein QR297_12075 [Pseudomonas shirazica]